MDQIIEVLFYSVEVISKLIRESHLVFNYIFTFCHRVCTFIMNDSVRSPASSENVSSGMMFSGNTWETSTEWAVCARVPIKDEWVHSSILPQDKTDITEKLEWLVAFVLWIVPSFGMFVHFLFLVCKYEIIKNPTGLKHRLF